jgi:hypothetical protein
MTNAAPSFFERLRDMKRPLRKLRNALTDVRVGIRNLIKWAPTIWRSRDWDQWFIYDVLEKKLRFHADRIESDALVEDYEKDVAHMRRCVDLCHKLKEQWYEEEQYRLLEEKWGELHLKFCPSSENGSCEMKLWRDRAITEEQKAQEIEDERAATEEAYRQAAAARAELFGILRDQIECWWD